MALLSVVWLTSYSRLDVIIFCICITTVMMGRIVVSILQIVTDETTEYNRQMRRNKDTNKQMCIQFCRVMVDDMANVYFAFSMAKTKGNIRQ